MSDPITIPPEALEAAARAFANAGTADGDRDPFTEACLAMLKAWPGMAHRVMPYKAIILPLTQENSDD